MTKRVHPLDASRQADMRIIKQIADRAVDLYAKHGLRVDPTDTLLDLSAVHFRISQLRLNDLLAADDFNFAHDVGGISRHLNRDTYQLENFFSPRFTARKTAAA